MSAVIEEEGGGFGDRVHGVIVGELEEVKILLPVVFSTVDKCSKPFDNSSICAFYLAVALGIVWRRVDDFCPKRRKDVLPEGGRELGALVREEAMWEPMVTKHVFDEKARGVFGGKLLRTRCKAKHLGELVREDQDAGICIWRTRGIGDEWAQDIEAHCVPTGGCCDGGKRRALRVFNDLVAHADVACFHVLLDILFE